MLKVGEGKCASLLLDIPNADGLVEARCGHGVVSRGMELGEDELLGVRVELSIAFLDILGDAFLRDAPKLDSAVLRGGSEQVVIERREFEIDNWTSVALNEWHVSLKFLVVVCLLHSDDTATLAVPWDLYSQVRITSNHFCKEGTASP